MACLHAPRVGDPVRPISDNVQISAHDQHRDLKEGMRKEREKSEGRPLHADGANRS
jgi:hypothetical protein